MNHGIKQKVAEGIALLIAVSFVVLFLALSASITYKALLWAFGG